MKDLPTGTVTFLFTDIEGSTRLLERLGERYRDVQRRHDAIVRAAIAEGHGWEVSTEGDAFFAVFPTPQGAVDAVTHAQRELAAEPQSGVEAVRVRMGLHTGEGILVGDSYLGLDVNRTARIAAAAHGGQVLLSDATRGLVDRSLPPGIGLRDLGLHRLKDLTQPERLHQLLMEGLEQDFAPPRTLDARPHNLPTQLTTFIGRERQISRIRELLATNRLVTLTGPGGIGKTRLALQVAAEALTDFRDGAFFVDLSALTEPELVAPEIGGALPVRSEPGRDVLDVLREHLREKDLLLVLDNFEQVLDAGSSVVEPLLRASPGLKALVTSRVPLHLYGEHEYPVPPLELPDPDRPTELEPLLQLEAVALFAERAAASKPDFRVNAQNARSVAEITARLDGLPLAIELAASRVKVLAPEQLLARLERRLPLLTAQDRNIPERQRTLRQTIEWSYDLLNEPEQRMFSRLSLFAGGAGLDAVEAVANPNRELELDTLDGLTSLVDKNLLRSVETGDGRARFAMLETIREYGLELLAGSGEDSTIRRRHAEHFIEVGERLVGMPRAEQAAMARQLEHDVDNLRAALSWAPRSGDAELALRLGAALRDFWRLGSHFKEAARWLDEILALPAAAGRTLLRARALTAAADLTSWTGGTDSNLRRAEEAVAIYRELRDPRGIADALVELGVAQMVAGHSDTARTTLEEARELGVELGDQQRASESSMALGLMALTERDFGQARQRIEQALTTFRDLGDMYWVAFAERLLGGIEQFEGNDEAAEHLYRTSLSVAHQYGILIMIASTLYAFADLAVRRGQPERALRLVGASEAIRDRVGEAPAQEKEMVGDVEGAARALLDEAIAERLYQEGRAMAPDDAVAYALQSLE